MLGPSKGVQQRIERVVRARELVEPLVELALELDDRYAPSLPPHIRTFNVLT